MPLSTEQLDRILRKLNDYGTTAADFLTSLLSSAKHADTESMAELAREADKILDGLVNNQTTKEDTLAWVHRATMASYAREILNLVKKRERLHFSARKASVDQLGEFDIANLSEKMQALAPHLWDLLGVLLSADRYNNARKERQKADRMEASLGHRGGDLDDDGDTTMERVADENDSGGDSEDEYWADVGELPSMHDESEDDGSASDRREALITIKKVVCMSVMMQSTNQRCNAMQSVIGVFLHAASAPETVVELLAHAGISISTSAINSAISSLSKESATQIRKLGRTLLAAYAYDNLDIDLKRSVATVEAPLDTLIHLMSGTLLPLNHGVTLSDLDCSEELWKKSRMNRKAKASDVPIVNDDDFLDLHPEDPNHASGLIRRERFIHWKFLDDLTRHGPQYFHRFATKLESPELIEEIPVAKSVQIPARMMDINVGTPAMNGQAISELLLQGGVGDPEDASRLDLKPVGNTVILVHGDLGTGQHIQSLQASRSEEKTPWRRYQFIIYVLGLFHLKMACADAIWKIFIQPAKSRVDANSLLQQVAQIRPKEVLKIESKPGFRRMHEIIQHIGIVSRLDCLRLEVAKLPEKYESLQAFALSKPTWDQIKAMAKSAVRGQVANETFSSLREAANRDKDRENTLLRQQYFLLYEELSYAMNKGDIGRTEDCFMPWVFIFRGCGKHKYATYMLKYLRDVHFIYPPGLKRAIRMNILCNPSGEPGKFRAIDWWVEHNNLFLKRIYGGKYSNHEKARILKESPLIGVFKNSRIQVENMFALKHRTIRHSPPKMQQTFGLLSHYMKDNQANSFVSSRDSEYSIPDVMRAGMHILMVKKPSAIRGEEDSAWLEEEDDGREGEVEDGGDLEV